MKQQVQISFPGAQAQVRWEAAAVGRALRDIFRYFGIAAEPPGEETSETSAARVTLRFSSTETVSVPQGAVRAASFDAGITAWRAEGRVFLTTEGAAAGGPAVRLDPAAGAGVGGVGALFREAPGQKRLPVARHRELTGLLVLSLFILLRRHGLYPLHAAALGTEDGGAGVLFIGASGAGKSTLAYSLVREGWAYLSDDSVLLRPGPAGVEALPFRRKFGLEPEAAEAAFPELASAWGPRLTGTDKRSLAVSKLRPAQAATRCLPRVLIFPEIADRPESELRPVGKAEAMHATTGQSALVTLGPDWAPRHLSVLVRLIGHTQHFRLLAGRDLRNDPAHVAGLIGPLLHRSDAHAATGNAP